MVKKAPSTSVVPVDPVESTSTIGPKPLVFISHDSRDADLAEAFSNLLIDVSGGTLKSFRSSDNKGTSGIEFGSDWYRTIMSRLDEATDVVALLTQRSIERPWILYEAGVAKGKLDTTVLGLAAGVPLSDVSTGPFGQFQNCADDLDSLTKLVVQLLKRNPDAAPREEAVRQQVSNFIAKKDEILSSIKTSPKKKPEVDEEGNIAKLFEEIKAMLRDVNSAPMISNLTYKQERAFKRIPFGMIEDLLMNVSKYPSQDRVAFFLVIASILRDDIPWLYEPVMELYRAFARGNIDEMNSALEQYRKVLKIVSTSPIEKYLFRMNEENIFRTHEILKFMDIMTMEFKNFSEKQHSSRRGAPGAIRD